MTCIKCPWHCRRVRTSNEWLVLPVRSPACRAHVTDVPAWTLFIGDQCRAMIQVILTVCSSTWPLDGA